MKLTAVSERVPYFLSKNSLDEKLQLLGLQTPGTKRLVAKTLSSHFSITAQLFVRAGQNRSINQMYLGLGRFQLFI